MLNQVPSLEAESIKMALTIHTLSLEVRFRYQTIILKMAGKKSENKNFLQFRLIVSEILNRESKPKSLLVLLFQFNY